MCVVLVQRTVPISVPLDCYSMTMTRVMPVCHARTGIIATTKTTNLTRGVCVCCSNRCIGGRSTFSCIEHNRCLQQQLGPDRQWLHIGCTRTCAEQCIRACDCHGTLWAWCNLCLVCWKRSLGYALQHRSCGHLATDGLDDDDDDLDDDDDDLDDLDDLDDGIDSNWYTYQHGAEQDNCNYDGYANSPYTIAVGAVDNLGRHAFYSEPCAALMVVAPSAGGTANIITTDVTDSDEGECTFDFVCRCGLGWCNELRTADRVAD
jgi:hypothetical protein